MPSLHRQAAVCALGACTGWCHSDVDMNGKCVGWGATVSMCMQSSRRLKARCILLRGFTLGSKHLPQMMMMMMMMMVWGLMFSDIGTELRLRWGCPFKQTDAPDGTLSEGSRPVSSLHSLR